MTMATVQSVRRLEYEIYSQRREINKLSDTVDKTLELLAVLDAKLDSHWNMMNEFMQVRDILNEPTPPPPPYPKKKKKSV